jgi:hypothetical protein
MVPAFEVICELLYRRGIAGATALLGVDGIAHGQRQRPPTAASGAFVVTARRTATVSCSWAATSPS